MDIWLNGEQRHFDPPLSISALLDRAGFAQRRVAVEVNQHIVPKSRHPEHLLACGDRVEIVHALGGG
jgi:sulfur carrier protein